ncbi:molybdenum cofactor guanylyltransferase [Halorubrum sp. F4]|uniref:molybdenum cofactor guanylyltransferase n=1 Tax=Halorubrum sp. F4 TaxID=2989715 RepID=UPI0024801320|nr:molybdenum cofactor guanylyltransferase [Halorubrum sp. F4]
MTTGLVLAGGRSVRFGDVDKALAEFDGSSLIRQVIDTFDVSTDRILISCRETQRPRIETAVSGIETPLSWTIDTESIGPLGGIRDGLERSRSEWTFVVGCDFPLVDRRLLAALAATDEGDAIVPVDCDAQLQPLCGRYRTTPTLKAIRSLLETGERRPMELLTRLETTTIDVRELSATVREQLVNVNTPGDLAQLDPGTRDR